MADRQNQKRARQGGRDYRRWEIYERDGGICYLCGEWVSDETYTIDHTIPISQGGEDTYDNVAVAHWRCNSSKGGKTGG